MIVDSQRPVLSQVRHVGAMRTTNETPARITLALVGLGPYTLNDSRTFKDGASLTIVPSDPAGPGFSPAIIADIRSGEYTPAAECEIGRKGNSLPGFFFAAFSSRSWLAPNLWILIGFLDPWLPRRDCLKLLQNTVRELGQEENAGNSR